VIIFRNYIWAFLIIILVAWLDQESKLFIYRLVSDGSSIHITSFFNIISAWNHGVSFGIMNNPTTSKWLLIAISGGLISILIYLLHKAHLMQRIAYSFIIGGAVGNVIDRLNYGAVFDFLDFHYQRWHYPTFNVADAFIVLGAAILLLFHDKDKQVNLK